jgi:DNA modification methylase
MSTPPHLKVINGDALAVLKTLDDESVQCCVTSPPYWGLRDYGVEGQMGNEPTFAWWLERMRFVFNEVHRCLRLDGTLWVNMGDSYCGSGTTGGTGTSSERGQLTHRPRPGKPASIPGLKAKDLIGQAWRLAFALQEDGWYLRSDIIWHKPNPMPESVYDRPTRAHEYIFLLSKSGKYHYDADAIVEKCSPGTHARLSQDVQAQVGSDRAHAGGKTNGRMKAVSRGSSTIQGSPHGRHVLGDAIPESEGRAPGVNPKASGPLETIRPRQNSSFSAAVCMPVLTRNKRTVWTVPTAACKDAHFATFPPDLIKPCILAGCPVGGVVLDPFGGSGTTGKVALELGRSAVLIELNPEYCKLIEQRCNITPGLAL